MAIKFRCSECKHGIKAPDKAAGRGVKCPQCGTKVRVPSGTRKKKVQKQEEPSSGDSAEFLANLDMDRLGHSDVELCQKCAAEIPEEETACPDCGFDPEELTVVGRKRKKMAAKGIDPATYYEKVWKSPFSFALFHKGLIFKTGMIFTFFFLLAALCSYFLIWVATVPPFAFWLLVTVVSLLIPLGWLLTVHTEIIRLTLRRKDKIKKIRFDFAMCGMNGIKVLAWIVVFGMPFWILFGGLGILLDYSGIPNGFAIGTAMALIPILCLTPQAMSHLAMPVEQPGWFAHKLIPTLGISFFPGLMWALLFIVINLPVIGGITAVYFVGGEKFVTFMKVRLEEGEIHTAKVVLDFGESVLSDEVKAAMTEQYEEASQREPPTKDWSSLILPICIGIISCFVLGFTNLVAARANGLFTFHLKKALLLISSMKERVYVKKESEEKVRTRNTTIPAPVRKRFNAFFLDMLIVNFVVLALMGIVLYLLTSLQVDMELPVVKISLISATTLLYIIAGGIYFASAESGIEQATPGKKAMGLYVCDDQYTYLTTMQGWARFLAMFFLSNGILFFIGSLMAMFRSDKKTLHDIVTGTQVRMDKQKKKKRSKD